MSDLKNKFVQEVQEIWEDEDYAACMMGGATCTLTLQDSYDVIKHLVKEASTEDLSTLFAVIGQSPTEVGIVPFITKARPDALPQAQQALGEKYGPLLEQKIS